MTITSSYHIDIRNKLNRLEDELKNQQLWQSAPPSPKQLASCEPFCIDTMNFETWLQWVFIPQLQTMIENPHFMGFTHQSNIYAMADYIFKDYQQQTEHLLKIIADIDRLINHYQ